HAVAGRPAHLPPLPAQAVGDAVEQPVQRRRNQVKHVTGCRAAPSRRATGKSFSPRPAASNSARLSAPRMTNSNSSESSNAGSVSVMRSNGASGGSGSGVSRRIERASSIRGSVFGNSEATYPSFPIPSQAKVKCGACSIVVSVTTSAPTGASSARMRPVLLAGWSSGTSRSSPGQTVTRPQSSDSSTSAERIGNGVEPPGTVIATGASPRSASESLAWSQAAISRSLAPSMILTSAMAPFLRHRAHRVTRKCRGAPSREPLAQRLGQEPDPFLGLVDPVVDQAVRGVVAGFLGSLLHLAQPFEQLAVVVAQFLDHRVRIELAVLICDVAGGADRADRDYRRRL